MQFLNIYDAMKATSSYYYRKIIIANARESEFDVRISDNDAMLKRVSLCRDQFLDGEGCTGIGAPFEFFCKFLVKFPTLGTGK